LTSEDAIIETLQRHTPVLPGYTSWIAEGHGHAFDSASVGERVRGRVKHGVLMMVITRKVIKSVLEKIETETPVLHITYWIEPVEAVGQLTFEKNDAEINALTQQQPA